MSTDFAATTLQAATVQSLATQNQASDPNQALPTEYLAVFDYWAQRVIAERAGSSRVPKPPNEFIAGFLADPSHPLAPSEYPGTGIEPGCAMPNNRPAIKPTPLYIEYSYARGA